MSAPLDRHRPHGNAGVPLTAHTTHNCRLNRLVVGEGAEVVGILSSKDVIQMALCDELSELDYSDLE